MSRPQTTGRASTFTPLLARVVVAAHCSYVSTLGSQVTAVSIEDFSIHAYAAPTSYASGWSAERASIRRDATTSNSVRVAGVSWSRSEFHRRGTNELGSVRIHLKPSIERVRFNS